VTRKRVTRPAAQTEIIDQADYLAEHASEAIAYRFLAAVDDTVNSLLDMPGIGALWGSEHPRLHDIRRKPVKGFPNHLVFYRATDDLVEVLHLYHAAQNIEQLLEEDVETGEAP
jgi:plasmid stabilization system protein ParE